MSRAYSGQRDQKRALEVLEQKSQDYELLHTGAGKQTWVLWKRSLCSQLNRHLFSLPLSLKLTRKLHFLVIHSFGLFLELKENCYFLHLICTHAFISSHSSVYTLTCSHSFSSVHTHWYKLPMCTQSSIHTPPYLCIFYFTKDRRQVSIRNAACILLSKVKVK